MCGRFTLRTSARDVAEEFGLIEVPDLFPRYNIAPTQPVPVVRKPRQLDFLRWGLIPPWADDPKIGSRMINARAETVATTPAFRRAFQTRRCLVIADGFYEWQNRVPFLIHRRDHRPFAFAGLWDRWKGIDSCTIITTDPNDLIRPLHDRMPVILAPEDYDRWLATPDQSLLRTYGADDLAFEPLERPLTPDPLPLTPDP
ncbi:MAG: SOS response-associated peptidase [Planctomycetes bacterium]|nr:SOS response-associated peptidase [Planctomycetota bacterium]